MPSTAPKNRKQLSILCILLSTIFLLQSCSESGKTSKKRRHARSHLVTIYTVKPEPIILTTTRTGTIGLKRSVKLFSQEEGEITKLLVDRGDTVKKNSLLVKIDDSLITVLLAKAKATREQTRQNLIRNQRLSRKQLVSKDQLIKAQTSYKIATADEELLKIRIRNTQIVAPFTGIISDRLADPGDVIAKHRHVLTLIDPSTYIINVKISELLIPHYKTNDSVNIQIDALGSINFKGKIVRIHPTIDPATRQGTLEIQMNSTPKGIKAGQLSRVTLTSHPRTGFSIPFNSLRRDKEGEFVYVVTTNKKKHAQHPSHTKTSTQKSDQRKPLSAEKGNAKHSKRSASQLTVKRHKVRSGLRHGILVEIHEGLQQEMKIVERGFLGLRPGKAILVVNGKKKKDSHTAKQKSSSQTPPPQSSQ
ncbi:Probable Co/Zn/Cd efflux system membrane fusion protein [hydrothermal vent metagenome]|uniref:Probable Co/Zn/Cd efflux system membrane fusion protein n=1 Tax=hydrothermal vent metagenome TaxID=652676 RepID=A0A3B0Z935_9ZZZZ